MSNFLQNLIRRKRDITDTTLRNYMYSIKRVQRLLQVDHTDFESRADDIRRELGGLKATVQKGLVTALIVAESAQGRPHPRLSKLLKDLATSANEVERLQRKTDTDKKLWISERDISKAIKRAKDDLGTPGKNKARHRVNSAIYFILLFLQKYRIRNDLGASLRFITKYEYNHLPREKQLSGNYLVGDEMIMLSDFKTAKHFRKRDMLPITYRLDRKMKAHLKKYKKLLDGKDDFVFHRLNGKPLRGHPGRAVIGDWLRAAFRKYAGKSISTSMMRKIFLTEMLGNDSSLADRLDTMKRMQQLSLIRQSTYVRK